jgi:hypothetical protein
LKRLTITYNDFTVFDGEVDEFTWQDNAAGVSVSGKVKSRPQSSGLMDIISQASRKKTEAVVEQKKLELEESK